MFASKITIITTMKMMFWKIFWNRKEGKDVIESAIIICVMMLRHSEKF